MTDTNASFTGTVPENYDRFMGPIFFEPYAADLASRISVPAGGSVLEIACGTGIVTKELRRSLAPDVSLTATDLNDAMIGFAREHAATDLPIEWKRADAGELPFDSSMFDAVVCQFGLMFVPDKQRAFDEAFRVLKPGGRFVFSVWDKLSENEFSRVAAESAARFFPDDPPDFYEIPFSLYDVEPIELMVRKAGFARVESSNVVMRSVSASAMDAARGLIEGTPMVVQITERDPTAVPELVEQTAADLAARFGDAPAEAKMSAFVFEATRE